MQLCNYENTLNCIEQENNYVIKAQHPGGSLDLDCGWAHTESKLLWTALPLSWLMPSFLKLGFTISLLYITYSLLIISITPSHQIHLLNS